MDKAISILNYEEVTPRQLADIFLNFSYVESHG